jgi:hypothetical protein
LHQDWRERRIWSGILLNRPKLVTFFKVYVLFKKLFFDVFNYFYFWLFYWELLVAFWLSAFLKIYFLLIIW